MILAARFGWTAANKKRKQLSGKTLAKQIMVAIRGQDVRRSGSWTSAVVNVSFVSNRLN